MTPDESSKRNAPTTGGKSNRPAIAESEPDLAPEGDTDAEVHPDIDDNPATAPALSDADVGELAARVEALLFVSPRPLNVRRIAELLGFSSVIPIRRAAAILREAYAARAFELRETAGGYQLMTRPEFEADVVKLSRVRRAQKLSQGALETLAVVAYKQPITRAELDAIRGAASDHHLRTLGERGLVRVTGRQRAEGTFGGGAALYGTTTAFLDEFGLGSTGELPREGDLGMIEEAAKRQAAEAGLPDHVTPVDPSLSDDGPRITTVEV